MSFNKQINRHDLFKCFVGLCGISLLAACGGGSTENSTNQEIQQPSVDQTPTVQTPANKPPTNVMLNTITSTATTANVFWAMAQDDNTPTNQLFYELHFAEDVDFNPSNASFKFGSKNVLSAQITGLKPKTLYTVKLVVIDEKGLRTVSPASSVRTTDSLSEGLSTLNDTGITQCANESLAFANCGSDVLGAWFGLNQDAEVGRDMLASKGKLNKIGSGDAGFDFTKISSTGEKLPASATTWSCVLDNHTGLMWENKTDDGGLHDKDNVYTWYDPHIQNGYVGDKDGLNTTEAFVKAVNAKSLCGAVDWYLPTVREINSIINYGKVNSLPKTLYNPAVDTFYFSNIKKISGSESLDYAYWTSSNAYYLEYATIFSLHFGWSGFSHKTFTHPALLVRSTKNKSNYNTPNDRYVLLNTGSEVHDKETGLIWQRCSLGQIWNGVSCTGVAATYTWQQAFQSAKDSIWRVPNIKELDSLLGQDTHKLGLASSIFPSTMENYYWSSSSVAESLSLAWTIHFKYADSDDEGKTNKYYVRLVRSAN